MAMLVAVIIFVQILRGDVRLMRGELWKQELIVTGEVLIFRVVKMVIAYT
jgi:hypothetical protein